MSVCTYINMLSLGHGLEKCVLLNIKLPHDPNVTWGHYSMSTHELKCHCDCECLVTCHNIEN